MKKISVLYSPIHYVLDAKNTGSEFLWAYSIYQQISKSISIDPYFITGGVRGVIDINVWNLQIFLAEKLNLSLMNIFIFYFCTFKAGLAVNEKKKVDIFHHVLPFSIGHSFNLLAFMTKKPFIIGPVQGNLQILDTDLNRLDARGFQNHSMNIYIRIENLLLAIITPFITYLSYATLKRASAVIVINEHTKKILLNNGLKKERIIIIPPGIDVKRSRPTSKNKSDTVINIIAVGYLLKRKGFDYVITAMQSVVAVSKSVHLDILGDGPQMNSLKQLTRELGLENFITFHGFVPQSEISSYYQNASIFINMSKSEGFATVCLEAMAAGLAIVSSRVGGFSDAIEDGVNGYLVEQEDSQMLAKRINYLISHKTSIIKIGTKAREDAVEKYDWEKSIIPQYISLYKRVLK